jgi:hypothetical protein
MSTKQDKLLEKEIELIQNAIKIAEIKKNRNLTKSPVIKNIFKILEDFLKEKKLVCYGGTAINNILPTSDQFYNKDIELPDYDFFSPNSLETAKELANLYYIKGFDEVEAKAGVHFGTYKVYVNFIPIADITQLDYEIFKKLQEKAISRHGILYAPPNYLRMAAYLELSRPEGDVSRWEKVWKRLVLLNKNYPLKEIDCSIDDIIKDIELPFKSKDVIFKTVLDSAIKQKLVFFGTYAMYQYSKYLPDAKNKKLNKHPEFDVLAIEPEEAANEIKKSLHKKGVKNISISHNKSIGEIIPENYIVKVSHKPIIYIYKTIACHSYNTIKISNKTVRVASIDTILSLYLAFLFSNREYYDSNRILCIAQYLFLIQIKNRLSQKGLLKRFTTKCYGKQQTLEDIRALKVFKYNELKKEKNSAKYNEYFLRYIPLQQHIKKIKNNTKKNKINKINKTKRNKTKPNKTKRNKSSK